MSGSRMRLALGSVALVGALPATLLASPGAVAAPTRSPAVLHVRQIDQQDVAPRPGSEPNTVVEPDVAVSPLDPRIAVAVGHDGRYAGGGAVDITYTWTHDGGASWHHAPVPYVTKAVGGRWDRASDPVVDFAPDGSLYLSAIVLMATGCADGIAVLRSTDGGQTWHRPSYAHVTHVCTYFDDKNWLTVDRQPHSPYYGRVYQFWTPFFFTKKGATLGSAQAVRWSDDKGRHWSGTHYLTPKRGLTQDSQPMIRPDGTVVDAYEKFVGGGAEAPDRPFAGRGVQQAPAASQPRVPLVSRVSTDGGATWSAESVISPNTSTGPADIRCCLPSATADPVTGRLYAAFQTIRPHGSDAVVVSTSTDGRTWSPPRRVDRDRSTAVQHVNVDVAAYGGNAFVSYGVRDRRIANGRYVQQELSSSYDGGRSFGVPIALGPRSDLRYAAFARAKFPGDYIGTAATANRVYAVWAVSYAPKGNPDAKHNQVMWGAVLRP